MRFEELLDRHERGQLTQAEAGEMLGMSERSFRRWQVRYREEGAAGLADRRVGQPSPRRAAEGELARARALYAELYDGFTVKHFHEKLGERHGYRLGYTVTRLALQAAGLVKRAPRRGAHRRKRPRRPLPGMLLHQDAARHGWLAGRPPLDLVVTLDDATSGSTRRSWSRRRAPPRACGAWPRWSREHGLFSRALHRPRQPLLPHPGGRRAGRPRASDPGRPGAGRARHRAHRRLLAAGARPLGARLPHPGGPAAQGAGAGRDHRDRRRQRLAARGLPAGAQRPLRGRRRAGGQRLRPGRPRSSGARCSACGRPARSATTTACAGRAAACRSRRARSGHTSSAPPCACTNTPTARSRSSGGRTASPTSRPGRHPTTSRRDPLRRRKRCGQRCRVAHTTTTTEADNRCAT